MSVLAPVPVSVRVPEAEPVVVPVDAVISVLVADAVLVTVFVATCEVPPPLPHTPSRTQAPEQPTFDDDVLS